MTRPSLRPIALPFYLACVATAGCNGDSVGGSGNETEGIDTLDGDSTGAMPTTLTTTTPMQDDSTSDTPPPPPCENGEQDGDETDVDCGGDCDPCGAGGQCSSNEDCATMICSGGFCQAPTCYDGMQNGSEEGVDCGGTCINSCTVTGCANDNQCLPGQFCLDGVCMVSSCDNQIIDTQESDVDCGGPSCPDCPDGATCNADADCVSGVCENGICSVPDCEDGAHNGNETDIDCGGPDCGPCPNGSNCLFPEDCIELVCDNGLCVNDTCFDTVQNGSETDTDCGGPECPPCDDGDSCEAATDCVSGVCNNGICLGAGCFDGVHNGTETDLDCGNACGATCVPGQDCDSSGDCVEGVCEFGECSAPTCFDDVANGNETGIDCGGACGATCQAGQMCNANGDCVQGVCTGGVCQPAMCNDGVQNGGETDTDCGGPCGPTCLPGDTCFSPNGSDCQQGVCTGAVCQAPTCTDGVANGSEVGIDCAGGCPLPCPNGSEVVVNSTLPDFQTQPAVGAAPNGSYVVVVWTSVPVSQPAQDGSGAGVFMRLYNAMGTAITGEIQVNTTTAGDQQFPRVDAGNTGFVVTWQGPDANGTGIFAQRFTNAGLAQGAEIAVNTTTAGLQRRPDVALRTSNNDFVVCWETQISTYEIRCQRYNGAGLAQGGEIAVNVTTQNNQQLPAVEMTDAGEFTVVWQSAGDQDGSSVGVFMRRYNALGTPLAVVDTQVNQFTTGDQSQPAIGMNGTGAFVIAWSSAEQDGSSTGVYARRYAANGTAQAGEFLVNGTTVGAQNNPRVALNADGDFAVVWQTADDGVLTGVYAQRYNQVGVAVSTEFRVNQTITGLQEEPDVAIRGADEIVAVFSDGNVQFTDRDIRMIRYTAQFP